MTTTAKTDDDDNNNDNSNSTAIGIKGTAPLSSQPSHGKVHDNIAFRGESGAALHKRIRQR